MGEYSEDIKTEQINKQETVVGKNDAVTKNTANRDLIHKIKRCKKKAEIFISAAGAKVNSVQIQYSCNKKFKKNVRTINVDSKITHYIIRGLKKNKKYYVRARTLYKNESGRVIHGKWSKRKVM